jgi:CAAX protease family protein
MKKKLTISIVVVLTFFALRYLKYFLGYVVFGKEVWNDLDTDVALIILNYSQIFIVFLVTGLLFKKFPFDILGLKKDILKGLFFGFIFTLPMFIGYGYQTGFQADFSLNLLHRDMIMAGFFEEFLFRGFLFGVLFFYGGWGFITAVIIPSIFFGIGHLYQAESFSDSLGVFLFTALGSAGFAWFYIAWRSLWMVIFLHGFMDLAWSMFSIEANATGNLYANIFRFTTLGLVILVSIRKLNKENPNYLKNRLWLNADTLE